MADILTSDMELNILVNVHTYFVLATYVVDAENQWWITMRSHCIS